MLRWFGKEPELDTRSGLSSAGAASTTVSSEPITEGSDKELIDTAEEVNIHDYYLTEGILEPCEDQNDLCLVNEFRTAWNDEMAELTDKDLDASEAVSILSTSQSILS
ncbi:hypothetical protein C453_01605 [Haloferax elongans ATCC BAA-1513]|uniref:DUF8054 domain-containing protein n=1 Tax=Haloferax elongans ATCC BAA-1513 TaxID=1230453 RepID=M0HZI4_HALEO|nr:hypothetical protein C453_01605 [Haloferax elongans ATCC BAA-1513]